MATGAKYDAGKLRWDLLPVGPMEQVVAVLTFGAVKYGPRQWQGGIAWHRMFGACMRHTWAWWRGEDTDPESGQSHLAHAIVNLLFLLWHFTHRKDLDDREAAHVQASGGRPDGVDTTGRTAGRT